jgi:hypothetical protein
MDCWVPDSISLPNAELGLGMDYLEDVMRAFPGRAPISRTGNGVHPPAPPRGVFSALLDMTGSGKAESEKLNRANGMSGPSRAGHSRESRSE